MNPTLPLEMQLALAAIAGLALGMLVMWLIMRPKSNQERAKHDALNQQFQDYRRQVDQHFVDTAGAVDELNKSYQKVVQHLSSGAQSLMGKEALQEQLARRSDKSVTVAYLAAATAAPVLAADDTADETIAAVADTPIPDAPAPETENSVDLSEQEPVSDAPVIPELAPGAAPDDTPPTDTNRKSD